MNKSQSHEFFQTANQRIWDQLDHQQWPDELATIKPRKWDGLDANQKGKVVLENLGQIIYHVTLLTNDKQFGDKQSGHKKPGYHADQEIHPNYIYP